MSLRAVLAVAVCLSGVCIAPFVGPELVGEQGDFILWQLRIPRVVMGMLVGATLGLTGAIYQTIFANPLATPSTVGTTAGAALGALVVLVFYPDLTISGLPIVAVAAFAGALLVTAFIASIAASGRARVNDVLLAGIAISLAASALTTGIQSQAGMTATFASVRWALGHLAQVGFQGSRMLAPIVSICAVILLLQIPALQAMVAGEDRAHAQGVNV
ncbi:MAG: iron chelate uptake ABC transporter family permease subunit, partial [Myxococcota bacterium]|nr:iron chelate uptake ABC transporter family permease subunit [Myxococcota bacterium]